MTSDPTPPTEPALPTWEECEQAGPNRTALQSLLYVFDPSFSDFRERLAAVIAQAEAPLRKEIARLGDLLRDANARAQDNWDNWSAAYDDLTTARAEIARLEAKLGGERMKGEADQWHAMRDVTSDNKRLRREVDQLTRKLAEANVSVIAFGGLHMVKWAREAGLPEKHLHPKHYDLLQRAGARMDDFVRADVPEAPPTATGENGHG